MGKVEHDRLLKVYYTDLFNEMWLDQSQEFRNICNTIGKEYGYSGMNVFYEFFIVYCMKRFGDLDYRPFLSKLT